VTASRESRRPVATRHKVGLKGRGGDVEPNAHRSPGEDAGPPLERRLSGEEIVELSKRHTIFDWQAQANVHPIPIERAKGVYFWDVQGRRYLDFNSQLWSVNIGHCHPRVIRAIREQAEKLPYVSPFMTTEVRALLGRKLGDVLPGDMEKVFFTLGGAEANEHAIKIAKLFTGRPKILARYRSYHGATSGAITLTGDPRRWPNEPGMPGVVHVLDPYHGPSQPRDSAGASLRYLEEVIELEGPQTIAAFILEPIPGTNGVLIPPDGYLEGVRELCDRFGILMVADEVMSGFGRTGEWFAVNHWGVVPDLITLAKGLTSSYVPLGGVGMRPRIAAYFEDNVFWGGLTYNSHPLALAAALATIEVYEEDDLIANARRMGDIMRRHHEALLAKHSCVGLVRNIGLFGVLELVRDRRTMEPLAPFNGTSEEMLAINRFLMEHGVYTFVRWNQVMTSPPLCIREEQLAEGFAVIDAALEIADRAVRG
jgi:taurine---2-oxoglutarate transaminase